MQFPSVTEVPIPGTFTWDSPDCLGFNIGGDGTTVYFDNILLRKVEALPSSVFSREATQSSTSLQNYPNPVNTETTFYYTLEEPSRVSLRIFNLNGQELETIENGFRQKGEHFTRWNSGKLPAGTYPYQLRVDEMWETRKLILIGNSHFEVLPNFGTFEKNRKYGKEYINIFRRPL